MTGTYWIVNQLDLLDQQGALSPRSTVQLRARVAIRTGARAAVAHLGEEEEGTTPPLDTLLMNLEKCEIPTLV